MVNEKLDLISRAALIEAVEKQRIYITNYTTAESIVRVQGRLFRKAVDEAPTVDAVEVVRCKDCKHFIQEEHGCNHFGYYSHTPWVDEVDFCSHGERREGE